MTAVARLLLRSSGWMGLGVAVLGITGGACNAGLIAVIHRSLSRPGLDVEVVAAFGVLALGKVGTTYASGALLARHTPRSIAKLRRTLVMRLLAVPFRSFERIGAARVFSVLTQDVIALNGGLQSVPSAVANLAIVAGGASYLLYLSPTAFAVVTMVAIAGTLLQRFTSRRARELLSEQRDVYDTLAGHYRTLTEGAKELRMHRERRHAFNAELAATTEELADGGARGHARYLAGQAANSTLLLAAIGFVLFALPAIANTDRDVAGGYVLTALYLMGPVSSLLRLAPALAGTQVALQRIDALGIDLATAGGEEEMQAPSSTRFQRIELREVTHRYDDEASKSTARAFQLGPLSWSLEPGDCVFVTGDNGSGKSTFVKVLVGLYPPTHGSIRVDGEEITAESRDHYRQLFSVVFSDFHLFDRLLGMKREGLDEEATEWLLRLGLASEVSVRDGVLSSTDLSQGQRKRLALMTAALENRPVYVFDEWAAEQDPAFRDVFYRDLVPGLAAQGKAVVVVTHDDRYRDVADRVMRMQDGRLLTGSGPKTPAVGPDAR